MRSVASVPSISSDRELVIWLIRQLEFGRFPAFTPQAQPDLQLLAPIQFKRSSNDHRSGLKAGTNRWANSTDPNDPQNSGTAPFTVDTCSITYRNADKVVHNHAVSSSSKPQPART